MPKPIKLTEAENQYLADLMLKQMRQLIKILKRETGDSFLGHIKRIDHGHSYNIYQKLTEAR